MRPPGAPHGDPSQKRKDEKRAVEASTKNTFGIIALEYIEKCEAEGIAEQTGYKKRWLLLDLAKPLSDKAITAITPADILTLLKGVEKTGRRETARRLRAVKEARRQKFVEEHPRWYAFVETTTQKKLRIAREKYIESRRAFYKRRAAQLLEMYRMREGGKTLQEIGNRYGLTRERVRQLLS